MLEILKYLFVVFGKYNSYYEYVCHNTKQTDKISEYFDSNLNFFAKYKVIVRPPNVFKMVV